MIEPTETLLADYAALDPVYVDGIAGVFNLGPNFSAMFFRWQPVRAENGVITYERAPAMVLIQPRAALLCGKGCRLNVALDAQQPPTFSAPRIAAGATFN
jgi:hypothetical protein